MQEQRRRRREEAQAELRRRFKAAEAFAALISPSNDQVREDLWSQLESPGEFAKKHPSWYQAQWGFAPGADFDWWGMDRYAWQDVQACLSLAGYAVLAPTDSSGDDVARAIAQLEPMADLQRSGGLQLPQTGGFALAAAMKSIAEHLHETTAWTLIQLRDATWDGGYVVSAAKKADLPELSRLALEADVFGLGIIDLARSTPTCT